MSAIALIRQYYETMNPAHKRVANFFIENSNIKYIEMGEVIKATGVSKSTISRFVKNLGFSGYKTFSSDLLISQASSTQDLLSASTSAVFGYSDITPADTFNEVCQKVFISNIEALKNTLELIDSETLGMMVNHVTSLSRIYIFASGRSSVAAESLYKRLLRLRLCCFFTNDPHEQALASTRVTKHDLVLGISAFGRSASVLHAMKRSKDKGAMVVGLTSHRNTSIEKNTTYMLYTVTSDPVLHSAEPSCTTTTHIVLLDCLYMMFVMKNSEAIRALLEEGAIAMEDERTSR